MACCKKSRLVARTSISIRPCWRFLPSASRRKAAGEALTFRPALNRPAVHLALIRRGPFDCPGSGMSDSCLDFVVRYICRQNCSSEVTVGQWPSTILSGALLQELACPHLPFPHLHPVTLPAWLGRERRHSIDLTANCRPRLFGQQLSFLRDRDQRRGCPLSSSYRLTGSGTTFSWLGRSKTIANWRVVAIRRPTLQWIDRVNRS